MVPSGVVRGQGCVSGERVCPWWDYSLTDALSRGGAAVLSGALGGGFVGGVASSFGSMPLHLRSPRSTAHRSVCFLTEPTAPELLFVGDGVRGDGEGCLRAGLVRYPGVRISSHRFLAKSPSQVDPVSRLSHAAGRAMVGASAMVQSIVGPACGRTGPSSHAIDLLAISAVLDEWVPLLTLQSLRLTVWTISPDRLERRAFSRQAADIAVQARRDSTRRVSLRYFDDSVSGVVRFRATPIFAL